jgi:riboflavin transporter FmnP
MKKAMDIKKLTAAAMLCALAYIVMVIGRVPVVLFLSYDPKDVIIALGGLIWGPMISFAVSVVVSFIEMITVSDTAWIGFLMNVISTCSFACTAAFIYKKKRTLSGAVVGLSIGAACAVAVMMLWNYLITPLYMGFPREAVVELLLPAFLPFNLLKAGLNAALTFLLYRPVVSALKSTGLIDKTKSKNAEKRKTNLGLVILALAIIVTCVLFILSLNGVI